MASLPAHSPASTATAPARLSPAAAVPAVRPWVVDALGAAAILGLTAKLYWAYDHVREIGLDDEVVYEASGARMGLAEWPNCASGLPAADTGPLYGTWYLLLSKVVPDRIALYYASHALLVAALGLAFFALVRALRVRPAWGVALTALLLTSRLLDQWPYPTYLSATVLLLGALAAVKARSRLGAARALIVAFGVGGFVRPEICTAFLVLLAVLAAIGLRAWWASRFPVRPRALGVAACFVPFVVLCTIFGSPLAGGRSFYAFGQHYAVNKVESGHLDINPWTNWSTFVQKDFGAVSTIGDAARANPRAFAWHLGTNAADVPSALHHVSEPLLALGAAGSGAIQIAWVAFVATGALALALRLRRRGWPRGAPGIAALALVVVAATTLASATLIHPRYHYFVPVIALGTAFCAAGVSFARAAGGRERPTWRETRWTAATCVAALLFTPNRAYGWAPQTAGEAAPASSAYLPRLWTALELRKLVHPGRVVVLEPAWGSTFLAGFEFDRVAPWEKAEPFTAFLAHRRIDLIIVNDELTKDSRFKDDAEFSDFLRRPEAFGFRFLDVPRTNARIAVPRT